MPNQILVPLDGSQFSEQALKSAYNVAQSARATVHLVRVVKPLADTPAEIAFVAGPPLTELRANAEKYLHECARRAPAGVATRAAVLSGTSSIAELLAHYIAQARIDFAIMSTHGRTGLGRFWIGSEADALVRTVNVPILLLRPHREEIGYECDCCRPRHILIPLDGSERAEAAIEAAVEIGYLSGARYTLMQVIQPLALDTYPGAVATQLDDHEIEHELDRARDYLENVARGLRCLRLRVDTVAVVHSSIADAIVHEATEKNVDVIAMGTHGRSGWSRLTLGSVSQDVLHKARVPLMVIRRPDLVAVADRERAAAGSAF